jgi:polar amino acid transport system substrate-binding protein
VTARPVEQRRDGSGLVALAMLGAIVLAASVLYAEARPASLDSTTVRIVTPLLPPHMTERGRGREASLIRAALFPNKVEFHVQPFERHWSSYLSDDRFDAVSTVPTDRALSGYASDPYIFYQNGISFNPRTYRGPHPRDLTDLKGQRVIAFAGALQILAELRDLVPSYQLYLEEKDQRIHSLLLHRKTVDAVVADGAIVFEYNRRLAPGYVDDTIFVPMSCSTPYRLVFRNADLRDDFNAGLGRLESTGRYGQIESKFMRDNDLKRRGYQIERCPP